MLLIMRRRLWLASIGILVVVAAAAIALGLMHENDRKQDVGVSNTCPHDKELRTYDQWRQTVTFPYIAPEAKLQRVTDSYSHVGIGSSKKEAVEAFGPPDFEQEMYPKETDRCSGYEFRYYFIKPEDNANEFKDKAH